MADCSARLDALRSAMADAGAGMAVIAPTDNLRYYVGWVEPAFERLIALFVPQRGEPTLAVPEMSVAAAVRGVCGVCLVRGWRDEVGWRDVAAGCLPQAGCVVVDEELAAGHLLRMQAIAPDVVWRPGGSVLGRARGCKSAAEIELAERAGAVADAVCAAAIADLAEGVSEIEVERALHRAYADRGAGATMALVCFGANAAVPHHASGGTRLRRGDVVLIDTGAVIGGYWSDITRTVAFGAPTDADASQVYAAVRHAHRAAFEAVRPGATAGAVDRAARSVIEDAGFGDRFTHRTGHGIGLSVHEAPSIVGGSDHVLREGECFTIEPGVYLPGRFGIRIEAVVTVRGGVAQYLNAPPPEHLQTVGER